jgi:hypothetical protein
MTAARRRKLGKKGQKRECPKTRSKKTNHKTMIPGPVVDTRIYRPRQNKNNHYIPSV